MSIAVYLDKADRLAQEVQELKKVPVGECPTQGCTNLVLYQLNLPLCQQCITKLMAKNNMMEESVIRDFLIKLLAVQRITPEAIIFR